MGNFWKRFKEWFFIMWRPILVFAAVAFIVGTVYGFHLGSLTRGVSLAEKSYVTSISSGKELLEHPSYLMHKLPVYALFKLHVHNIAAYRAISALFATLAVVSCFFILREWYSDRVAVIGTWLFMTSAWILHIGRLATPESTFLLLMPVLWMAVWLYNTTLRKSALLVLCGAAALLFYTPGFGWLVIITAVWQRKRLWKELLAVPVWYRALCAATIVVILLPLLYGGLSNPRELLVAAGLPQQLPTLRTLGTNLVHIPSYLLYQGPLDATKWLGRLPLLDIFSTGMMILGVYSMRYHLKLVRIQLLVGSALLLIVLITLGGPVTVTALLPIIYILIMGGIAFMLQQWSVVFPLNPIARTIATTLMSVCVLFVSYYHINHYFIAWPQTPATRAAFNQSLVK